MIPGLKRLKHLSVNPVYARWLLFIGVFVAVSGLAGSWLISTQKLLFPFYFWLYGSAGKLFLFGILSFLLLVKDQIFTLEVPKFQRTNLGWGVASVVSLVAFFLFARQLLDFRSYAEAPALTIATHLALVGAGLFSALASLGWPYIKQILQKCRSACLLSGGLSLSLYVVFGYVYTLWPLLSGMVLWAVINLLRFTIPNVNILPPLTIQLPQFSVTIGEYCSGIESLFLLTVLYVMIGILERKNIQKIQFVLLYFPLICGMFCINILRVYLIIQSGVLFSPEIAAKLFHTYLGILLFMGYFVVFLRFFRPRFIRKVDEKEKAL